MSDATDSSFENSLFEIMALTNEGRLFLSLGDFASALDVLSRKHELIVKKFGQFSLYTATSGVDLAEAMLGCDQFENVAKNLEASIATYLKLDITDHRMIRAKQMLAWSAYKAADYPTAEAKFRDLIASIRQQRDDQSVIQAAIQADYLAQVLMRQRRYAEAETILVENLNNFERLVPKSEITSVCLGILGKLYSETSRFREAENILRRSLELTKQIYGETSGNTAIALDHLATCLCLRAQRENDKHISNEAVAIGEKALSIFRSVLPANHSSVYNCAANLSKYRNIDASIGMMYPKKIESTPLLPPILPKAHPDNIKRLLTQAKELAEIRLFEQSFVNTNEAKAICLDNPHLKFTLLEVKALIVEVSRRKISFLLGEFTGSLSPLEHLQSQMRAHQRRGSSDDSETVIAFNSLTDKVSFINDLQHGLGVLDELITDAQSPTDFEEARAVMDLWRNGTHVGDALELVHYAQLFGALSSEAACEKASVIMQLRSWNEVAMAASTMEAATPEGIAFKKALKKYARLTDRLTSGMSFGENAQLFKELETTNRQLNNLEKAAGKGSGVLTELIAQKLKNLMEIQTALLDHEAILSFIVGTRATFILVITTTREKLIRVEYEGSLFETFCEEFKKTCEPDIDGDLPKFGSFYAAILYQSLIKPLEQFLTNATSLRIIPDGPLWLVPFEALISELEDAIDGLRQKAPKSNKFASLWEDSSNASLMPNHSLFAFGQLSDIVDDVPKVITNSNAWFSDHYSIQYVRTLGRIGTRKSPRDFDARKPFLGFGNPTMIPSDKINFAPLPQTERLLDNMASILGANPEVDIFVRNNASVSKVVELDRQGELNNTKILCFATHAIYPLPDDDILSEPGLVMSNAGHAEFILNCEEIENFNLDADLVFLTGCFTSSPTGKDITMHLSGLPKSFFAAGARMLISSNWPIDVGASELYVQHLLTNLKEDLSNLPEAKQMASRAIMRQKGIDYTHPFYWASFSLVK